MDRINEIMKEMIAANTKIIAEWDNIIDDNQDTIFKYTQKLFLYRQEQQIMEKMQRKVMGNTFHETLQMKEALDERLLLIDKVANEYRRPTKNFKDTLKELAIQTLICKVFGFPEYSEFEWNLITNNSKIVRNLKDVELFMFDDPDIKEQINSLKVDFEKDQSVLNTSMEHKETNWYPIIKSRYDDIDFGGIPHHWQGIDPLLYHLLIWGMIMLSIYESTEEVLQLDHQTKKANHKKNCLEYDIEEFKSKLHSGTKIINPI